MKAKIGAQVTVKGVKGVVTVMGVSPKGIVGRAGKKIIAAGSGLLTHVGGRVAGTEDDARAASEALERQLVSGEITRLEALASPHATVKQLVRWLTTIGDEPTGATLLAERFAAVQKNPLLPLLAMEGGGIEAEAFLYAYFQTEAALSMIALKRSLQDPTTRHAVDVLVQTLAPYVEKLPDHYKRPTFVSALSRMQEWVADSSAYNKRRKSDIAHENYDIFWQMEDEAQRALVAAYPVIDGELYRTKATIDALHRALWYWDANRFYPTQSAGVCEEYAMEAFDRAAEMVAMSRGSITVAWLLNRERAAALRELTARLRGEDVVVGAIRLSYLGQCDRLRRQGAVAERFWQEMMYNKRPVTLRELEATCDVSAILDEGERLQDFVDKNDHGYFRSEVNGQPVWFVSSAVFEFIFTARAFIAEMRQSLRPSGQPIPRQLPLFKSRGGKVGSLEDARAASEALAAQLESNQITVIDALRSPHATVDQLTIWLRDRSQNRLGHPLWERFAALNENPLLPMISLDLGATAFLNAYFLSEWELGVDAIIAEAARLARPSKVVEALYPVIAPYAAEYQDPIYEQTLDAVTAWLEDRTAFQDTAFSITTTWPRVISNAQRWGNMVGWRAVATAKAFAALHRYCRVVDERQDHGDRTWALTELLVHTASMVGLHTSDLTWQDYRARGLMLRGVLAKLQEFTR